MARLSIISGGGQRVARTPICFGLGACYIRRRKTRDREVTVKITSHVDVMRRPRLPTMKRVRKRVLYTGERQASGSRKRGRMKATLLVRQIFCEVSKTPGYEARVVSGKESPMSSVIGAGCTSSYFHCCFLRGGAKNDRTEDVPLNAAVVKRQSINNVIYRTRVGRRGKITYRTRRCRSRQARPLGAGNNRKRGRGRSPEDER